MKRTGILIGGVALAGATLAVPGGAAQAQTEHAILAIPAVSVQFLAEYVAEDAHLWEKQGLEVKEVSVPGIGAINAVIANSADFSLSSGPSISRAYARGQKLVALAMGINESGEDVVIRKDIADAAHFDPSAPLSTRAQVLKGRTIAVQAVGALPDVVLRVVAKSAGLTPDQMVITPMQPPEAMAAFARKAIDGAVAEAPFLQQVVLDGTGVIVSESARGEPTEFSPIAATLLLTRAELCATHRSICEKMVRGFVEATRIILNQPAQAIAIMKGRFSSYDDKVLSASYEMIKAMTPEPPAITAKELENCDSMNVAAGFLKPEEKLADYSALIDSSFIK